MKQLSLVTFIGVMAFCLPLLGELTNRREGPMPMSNRPEGELTVFVGVEGTALFPTLENYTSRAFGRDTVYSAVLGRLLSVDASGEIHQGIVERWSSSEDHRVWRFSLRPGIEFHHGRKATAQDLEYSLIRYLLSSKSSPGKAMRLHIEGSEEVALDKPFVTGVVKGVKVVDDLTVEVRLNRADPFFNRMLAGGRDSLVPNELIAGDHFCWKDFPVGAGPYQIVSVEEGGKIVRTKRFGKYHLSLDEKTAEAINFYNYRANGVAFDLAMGDRVNPDPQRLSERIINFPATISGIYFNYNSPLGRNEDLRHAVALTVRRAMLIEQMADAVASTDMIASNFEGRLQLPEAPDIEEAKRLFEIALGKGSLTLRIPVPGVSLDAKEYVWMKRLQQQFREAGVSLVLESSSGSIFDPKDVTSPFYLVGFIPDVSDPFTIYRVFKEKGPWIAQLPEPDSVYENLLNTDIGKLDKTGCMAVLEKLGRRFTQKRYAVPLFEQKLLYWVNPRKISSLGEGAQRQIMSFEALRLK